MKVSRPPCTNKGPLGKLTFHCNSVHRNQRSLSYVLNNAKKDWELFAILKCMNFTWFRESGIQNLNSEIRNNGVKLSQSKYYNFFSALWKSQFRNPN